ncbi:MAG: elongation factor P [Alphaproteobacteria bacterium]|nr:elongation factor P [Alphaproteobacteria bacterium]
MKIAGNEIKPGAVIEHDATLWVAVKSQAVKPGKGGAYNQVELKNLFDGRKLNERFRSAESVESIELDFKAYTFLFEAGEMLTFMDKETFDQIEISKDFVGERAAFLSDGMDVKVESYEGKPISIKLPVQVLQTVVETDPAVKGQTAAPSYKPAILDNGLKVMVPPFIDVGSRIIVSTDDVLYVKRAE